MNLTRALLPAALAGALLMSACSAGGSPSKDASGADCVPAGSASDSIEVKGDVGSGLELTSKTPVEADTLQRTVLKDGEGDAPKDGQQVEVAMTMFNGKDGSVLQEAPAAPTPFAKGTLFDWAYDGLRCGVPGQEVALAMPFTEAYPDLEPEQVGLSGVAKDDTVVVVMSIGKVSDAADDAGASGEPGTLGEDELLKKAEGKAVPAPEGFPTVKLADDGSPTITMPKGVEPPSKLEVATLIEGDGETVEPGDRVYVNYRGVIWRTGEEFDSSWSRGEPANFVTTQVIGGFQKALEGQKVGSQVIAVVPAEDGGYGGAQLEQMGHQADDVMVFVLDILGTVHADSGK
ncbi:FKBP-type peptidyl-prolyl cis-trans isomerase [Leucobacter massiliensis]|uniref:peptidylprolyl isomerase n=1 Tax=Leucobacter massiliensis TaxID=1686285 RepID=A0A2S9QL51_9MICO|nr:FKBP-type peptidyl-prolyl cis-trans isomerase [Leucobacter massiliensis]PRI10314.1 peptidylprolyl isomerase [Leucobacter massiliensis]